MMLAIRRFRIFVLITLLTVATVYYLFFPSSLSPSTPKYYSQPLPNHDVLSDLNHDRKPAPVDEDKRKNEKASKQPAHGLELSEPEMPDKVSTPKAILHSADDLKHPYDDTEVDLRDQEPLKKEGGQPKAAATTGAAVPAAGEGNAAQTTSSKQIWKSSTEKYPVPTSELIKLPTGPATTQPKVQHSFKPESASEKANRQQRQNIVRENFLHAWRGYKKFAMGHDEIRPLTLKHKNPFMGCGATLIDTLDTLWIMDLQDEFELAVAEVAEIDFKKCTATEIKLFETTIRYLGGLIAAYDLSSQKYPELLSKAVELADILMGAFDTPNRMPHTFYYWIEYQVHFQKRAGKEVCMAELGSLAMEFTRLAQLTGETRYYDAIARVTNALEDWQMKTDLPGLWPLQLDASGCKEGADIDPSSSTSGDTNSDVDSAAAIPGPASDSERLGDPKSKAAVKKSGASSGTASELGADKVKGPGGPMLEKRGRYDNDCRAVQGLSYSPKAKKREYGIGGRADSTYEYLPKMYKLLGGREGQYQSMYRDSVDAIREKLLFQPMIPDTKRKLMFPATIQLNLEKGAKKLQEVFYEGTHLSCFAGGMFGLAAKVFGIEGDMDIAKRLTDGCVWAYESTPSGVMPESFLAVPCESDSCTWSETKWHDALDPDKTERLKDVDTYNKFEKAVYGTATDAEQETVDQIAMDRTAPKKAEATIFKGGIQSGENSHLGRRKRDLGQADGDQDEADTIPSRTSTPTSDHVGGIDQAPSFKAKSALSHEKFVQARIQEERLPPGFTKIRDASYKLRPEAIESVFIMYRLTGEESWRTKGWTMFESIINATTTTVANAAVADVTSALGEQWDSMESFWLAETLKYFYLLYSEPSLISLDEYVFNTEAHPFLVPK